MEFYSDSSDQNETKISLPTHPNIVGGFDDSNYNDKNYADVDVEPSGYALMRYLAKTYADSSNSGIKYNGSNTAITVTADYDSATLTAADYDSTVVTITGASRSTALKIEGNSKANVIIGTRGADTIDGGAGNDTLTGGSGRDVFLYASSSGNDVITDYTAGQDSIKITGARISRTSVSGNDVVLSVGSGSIRVKNGKGKSLSLYNNSNSVTTTIIGGSSSTTTTSGGTSTSTSLASGLSYASSNKTLNVRAPFTGTLDLSKYASTVTTVNASSDNKFVNIKGTSRNELIRAGRGVSTITGGKGADTIYGGTGADTFVYASGDGKDVIYNYTSYVDTIKISSGTISRASISGSDVVLSVGSGSITVKNAKGKDINITNRSGETKTYNFTSTVSNPINFEERWFLDNSELGMRNSELGAILNNNAADIEVDYKFADDNEIKPRNFLTRVCW